MTEIGRERLWATGWIAIGLLLIAILYFLISNVSLTQSVPRQFVKTSISLLPPPSSSKSPQPMRRVLQRTAGATRAAPTPTPVPKPLPASPAPKAPAPAVAKPLTMDTPAESNSYNVPQGANEGFAIGGGGNGGNGGGGEGGGGCDAVGAKFYPALINSQLRSVFTRNETTDIRTFQVEARLWFDSTGRVNRAQLVGSTGDATLDMDVTHLLGDVNVGENIPPCLQPATVWVSQPWNGSSDSDKRADQTKAGSRDRLIWRTTPRR
jgi:protein TonB